MPSPRKRIGFLPRAIVQELIAEIANKEKLSQSKVVGILVEEALQARGIFVPQISDAMNTNSSFPINGKNKGSAYLSNELNELISDKGIFYDKKLSTNKNQMPTNIGNNRDLKEEEDLFTKFKEFLEFKKMHDNGLI